MRLVISVVKKFVTPQHSFDEMLSDGIMTMLYAIDKFDYDRGFRFSTYASWWIRQYIERAIINQGKLVRLPVHVVERLNRYLGKVEQLGQALGREPESGRYSPDMTRHAFFGSDETIPTAYRERGDAL